MDRIKRGHFDLDRSSGFLPLAFACRPGGRIGLFWVMPRVRILDPSELLRTGGASDDIDRERVSFDSSVSQSVVDQRLYELFVNAQAGGQTNPY